MHLSRFPRVKLAHLPTPLEPMLRLGARLGLASLWVKRDDCTGLLIDSPADLTHLAAAFQAEDPEPAANQPGVTHYPPPCFPLQESNAPLHRIPGQCAL